VGIEESEGEIIREMARLCTDENLGFKAISDTLNERGLQRASGHWVPSSVQHILRNPVLKGVMVYGRRPKKGNPQVTLRLLSAHKSGELTEGRRTVKYQLLPTG
jgi:hypothetical protein